MKLLSIMLLIFLTSGCGSIEKEEGEEDNNENLIREESKKPILNQFKNIVAQCDVKGEKAFFFVVNKWDNFKTYYSDGEDTEAFSIKDNNTGRKLENTYSFKTKANGDKYLESTDSLNQGRDSFKVQILDKSATNSSVILVKQIFNSQPSFVRTVVELKNCKRDY